MSPRCTKAETSATAAWVFPISVPVPTMSTRCSAVAMRPELTAQNGGGVAEMPEG